MKVWDFALCVLIYDLFYDEEGDLQHLLPSPEPGLPGQQFPLHLQTALQDWSRTGGAEHHVGSGGGGVLCTISTLVPWSGACGQNQLLVSTV